MNIEQWWPQLRNETRDWLVEHNGEPMDPSMSNEITAVLGGDTERWLTRESDDEPWALSDEAVDWIEAWANDEDPNV